MKLVELHEALVQSEDDDMTKYEWYIVREKDDAIAAGPYESKKQAMGDTKRLVWYNKAPNDYFIEFGCIDPDFDGGYDKFKPSGA